MTTDYLPNPVTLPSDVIVKLEVVPIPKPDADGRYRLGYGYSIDVGLFRGRKLIELRPIGTIICSEPEVEPADGLKLDKADTGTLDSEGWDQLLDLDMVPTELVLQMPR